jgi:hypothetical protein
MRFVRLAALTVGFVASAGFLAGSMLKAQSLSTARKDAEFTVFGGYTVTSPDYGPTSYKGMLVGGNFTVFKHWFVDPSLEVRYDWESQPQVSEHAFLVGPRAQKDYGRFHPYVDFLVGGGFISYNPPPTFSPNDHHDGGINLTGGGGVDIDVTKNFSAKFDVQAQHWNLGKNAPFQPDGQDYTLTPRTYSVGVTYHIPFSGLRKQKTLYEK